MRSINRFANLLFAASSLLPCAAIAATSVNAQAQPGWGILPEPLAAARAPSLPEKTALAAALQRYRSNSDAGDTQALRALLATAEADPWRASLWLDVGLAERHAGRYSAALNAFANAQQLAGSQRTIQIRAISEQLQLQTELGHPGQVQQLLTQLQAAGVAAEGVPVVSQAKLGLWDMQQHPQSAFDCGRVALSNLWQALGKPIVPMVSVPMNAKHPGLSLSELVHVAGQQGRSLRAVAIGADAPIPVPSVVHWKSGHYATIVARDGDHYRIRDASLGDLAAMSEASLRNESSGYFLLPESTPMLAAYRQVNAHEGAHVLGAGYTNSNDPHGFVPDCGCHDGEGAAGDSGGANGAGGNRGGQSPGSPATASAAPSPIAASGMMRYSISPMLISLSLTDTPLSYTPPKGPSMAFTLSYNQLDTDQPTTFGYSNVGALWTHNWLSYVQDDPTSAGNNVLVYMPGGPGRLYTGYSASTGAFNPEAETGAQLVETSTSPVTYERRFNDGSKDVYASSDSASSYPRHIFLSRRVDAHGNTATLAYDSQHRLSTVTDALGHALTFHYDNTSMPLQLTSVSDAFGRTAKLAYDSSNRLASVTDAIGMTSSVAYDSGTSVTALTTPYGTTQFATGQSGVQRWINVTDAQGNVSRMEFNESVSGIPFSETLVPNGVNAFNSYIDSRDSFYWDAQAYKLYAGDYTKALNYHWSHLTQNGGLASITSDSLESVKYPLENRIWYNHVNAPSGGSGTLNVPIAIGRIQPDNSTTQLTSNTYNALGNRTSYTDASGLVTTYTYASNQVDLLSIDRAGSNSFHTVESFTYDNNHDVLTHTDAMGGVTTCTYNSAGQKLSQTDPLGHVQKWSYDSNGYPVDYTDANGNVTTYSYDSVGRLEGEADAAGNITTYSYDALNRRTTSVFPNGGKETDAYSKLDVISHTDRAGHVTSYSYDGDDNLVKVTDPLQHNTSYTYYPNSLMASRTDANGGVTQWTRDIEGRVTALTAANGGVTQFAYDSSDRLSSKTNALGQVTSFVSYDAMDRLTELKNIQGVYIDYTYNAVGWPLSRRVDYISAGTRSSSDATTTLSYNLAGRPISSIDPDGVTTSYTYDAAQRLTRITDALGNYKQYTLDANGNRTAENYYAAGASSPSYSHSTQFNDLDLPAKQLDAQGNTTTLAYDADKNLSTSTDAKGVVTLSNYDVADRLSAVTQNYSTSSGEKTSLAYDAADRLTGVTDAAGLGTAYQLDALGHVTALTSPDTGKASSSYDSAGRLISRNDARGVVSQYSYDKLDRLTAVVYPAHPALNITYGYDELQPKGNCSSASNDNVGHMTSMTDASGSTAWCYTNQGDANIVYKIIHGASYGYGYSFSPGRRMTVEVTPGGTDLSYKTDAAGRVISVTATQSPYGLTGIGARIQSVNSIVSGVTYAPFGPVTGYTFTEAGKTNRDGTVVTVPVTRGYDANYRLVSISSAVLSLNYQRDALGQVSMLSGSVGGNGTQAAYTFGNLGRLTQDQAPIAASSAITDVHNYAYNQTGDRRSVITASPIASVETDYGYTSGTHHLSSITNASTKATQSFGYDAAGNTTSMADASGVALNLGYDDRNELSSVARAGASAASYDYDGLGFRDYRAVTYPAANTIVSIYDPNQGGNVMGTYSANEKRDYIYLEGMPVAEITNPNTTSNTISNLYTDALGTIRAATNSAGTVTYHWTTTLNAFGDQSPTGTADYPNGFPGQMYDAESGLYYNVHRYYDAATGRYVQSDPLGLVAGPNTFTYTANNPLTFLDPLGLRYAPVEQGHLEAVAWLIERGANRNLRNDDGLTPSTLAFVLGHDAIRALFGALSEP